MIRLKAFLISIVLVLITLVILDKTYVSKIENYYKTNDNSVRYSTAYEKYKSKDYNNRKYHTKYTCIIRVFRASSDIKSRISSE